ncbi:MAG TPA: DnaJ domain-containing protein [Polyangiaceae bacterium]|jgi:curved DNA-binding protein CbpA
MTDETHEGGGGDDGRSGEYVLAWLAILDELTYYDLFGVRGDATPDDIQAAFHVFCDTFHPDRHMARTPEQRDAVGTIFKRGAEAYAALCDPRLRGQYDEQLAIRPSPRPPPRISFSPHSRPPSLRAAANAPLEDSVRSPSARPFARRAEELIGKGDLRQAKLQLVMANHMDPDNEALETALRDLDLRLASPK